MLYTTAMNTKRGETKPVRTMVMLSATEKSIVAKFADEIGIESQSAALRQIVREWARMHEAESGELLETKRAA